MQGRFFEEHLIPEIYALYKEGKIDRKSIDEFLDADPEVQRSILQCLSIEREVVPDALLEKHEREIASVTRKYGEDIDAVRKELATAKVEKKKAQETLMENGKELEKIRERAEDTLARYKKSKEQITKEVEREIKKEIEDLKKERETREAAMKAKQDEIDALNGKIKSLDATIYGYDAQVALWKHEVARMSETYNKSVAYYSNPALIEIQLQVISEFVESLVRFSECHKWDAEASKTVEKYRKSIGDLLEKLAGQVKAHQKEVVSLQESEKAIAAQGGVEAQDEQKAS